MIQATQAGDRYTTAQWKAMGEAARHRGHRIFYVQGGDWGDASKPVLTLIHGFPTSSWDWQHQWDALCQHFRVFAPDMLGFGFSDKPPADEYLLMDQADLFSGLLDALGVRETHVLAHDYGDTVGQELLARHNGDEGMLKILSVCWLNGGLFPEMHKPRLIQKLLHTPLGGIIARSMGQAQFNRSFSAVFGPDTQPSQQELDAFWALIENNDGKAVFHKLIRYMAQRKQHRNRWVSALLNTYVPMRLINGPEDPVSGGHLADFYEAKVPRADVVRLPGIGHYPQVEAPQAVLDALFEFQRDLAHDSPEAAHECVFN